LNYLSGPSDDKASAHGLLNLASEEPQRRAAVLAGLVYGLLAALGWGTGLAAARHGFSVGFEPLDLLFIRFAVATPIFLVVFCLMRRWDRLAHTRIIVAAAQAFFGGPMLAICVSIAGRKAPFAGGVLLEVASLTVCSIVLARLVLSERLGILRTVALLALTLRLVILAAGSLDEGTPDVVEGMVLFAAAGFAAAAFAALTCRWHSDPIATMTIVSVVTCYSRQLLRFSLRAVPAEHRPMDLSARADRRTRRDCGCFILDRISLRRPHSWPGHGVVHARDDACRRISDCSGHHARKSHGLAVVAHRSRYHRRGSPHDEPACSAHGPHGHLSPMAAAASKSH
jgi:hypothetical protein